MASEDATLITTGINIFKLTADTGESVFPLRGEMLVGRELDCEIVLDYGHISRYHAKLNLSPGGVYLEDLHSTNGTFVNGHRIRGRVRLNLGDVVAFDDIVYRLEASVGEPSSNEEDFELEHWIAPAAPARAPASIHPFGRAPQPAATPMSEPTQAVSSVQAERIASRSRNDHIENDFGNGPRVIVTTAPLRGRTVELDGSTQGTAWRIGRDSEADICLNDATVSLDHAVIEREEDRYTISLASGGNGLMVNGQSCKAAVLHHDDRVQIGRMELLFRSDYPVRRSAEDDEHEASGRRKHAWTWAVVILSAAAAWALANQYQLI